MNANEGFPGVESLLCMPHRQQEPPFEAVLTPDLIAGCWESSDALKLDIQAIPCPNSTIPVPKKRFMPATGYYLHRFALGSFSTGAW